MSDDQNAETGFTPLTNRMWRGGDRFSSMGQIHDVNVTDGFDTSSDHSPHAYIEQTIMPEEAKALQNFVDWPYWAGKRLWTAEQGFTLLHRLDPKEFATIKRIPGRSQREDLYPFAATLAYELQELTNNAMEAGDLIFTAPPNFCELSPQDLFKKATLDPKHFLKWADGLAGHTIPPELRHLLATVEAPASVEQLTPKDTHIFRKENGNIWTIRMDGEKLQLKELAGFIFLREALRNPGKSMSFFDLFKALELRPGEEISIDGDAPATLDKQARLQCQAKIEDLEEERRERLLLNDMAGADRVTSEIEELTEQLLAGFTKKRGPNKKIGDAVRKKIKTSVDKILTSNPVIGQHFVENVSTEHLALTYRCATSWLT